MITYTCDTCGNVIDHVNDRRSITVESVGAGRGEIRIDSCRACVDKLKAGSSRDDERNGRIR